MGLGSERVSSSKYCYCVLTSNLLLDEIYSLSFSFVGAALVFCCFFQGIFYNKLILKDLIYRGRRAI